MFWSCEVSWNICVTSDVVSLCNQSTLEMSTKIQCRRGFMFVGFFQWGYEVFDVFLYISSFVSFYKT